MYKYTISYIEAINIIYMEFYTYERAFAYCKKKDIKCRYIQKVRILNNER